MQENYEYLNGDSVVSTIQFDAIDISTRQVVTLVNHEADQPTIDFKLFPSGLGFQQEVDVVEGDTVDYVIKQTFVKKTISLTLMWKGESAFLKYKNFLNWISSYNDLTKYHIRFSYALGGVRRKVELAVTNLDLKERDGFRVSATLTLQPLSPFYEEEGATTTVNQLNTGKIYNYSYPYKYGGGAYSGENTITNNYLKAIPLKITLYGPMSSPFVTITAINADGSVGAQYGNVQFDNVTLQNNEAVEEKLVIDAFSNRIYLETTNKQTGGTSVKDMFSSVNKQFNSFLLANPGKSKIAASLSEAGSKCEVYYVRYVL